MNQEVEESLRRHHLQAPTIQKPETSSKRLALIGSFDFGGRLPDCGLLSKTAFGHVNSRGPTSCSDPPSRSSCRVCSAHLSLSRLGALQVSLRIAVHSGSQWG